MLYIQQSQVIQVVSISQHKVIDHSQCLSAHSIEHHNHYLIVLHIHDNIMILSRQ